MNIYLIGFMGSGKTTVGKRLAAKLNYDFVDLDHLIEDTYHISIPDIFNRFDEDAFRKMEHDSMECTKSMHNTVISTGGGTPCYFNNLEFMNKHGLTVYLKLHPASIYKRLTESKKKRPLIANKSSRELQEFINAKLEDREPFYSKAQYTIKAENLDVSSLTEILQKETNNKS